VSEERRIDPAEIAELTARLHALTRMSKEMGAIAREGTAAIDEFVVAEHPDLSGLGDEMRNVYPDAFDDPA
jgi:hypothetical protein